MPASNAALDFPPPVNDIIGEIAERDHELSLLERVEIQCARQWAEAYARISGKPAQIIATMEGAPLADERDWRRAWIEIRALKFGARVVWDYPREDSHR